MITGLSIVTVWVLDRDSAKKFYTEQLGFTLTNDIELETGMRWLTVRPPDREDQELLLLDPMHSMLDEESAHLAGLSEFVGKPISLSAESAMNPEQYDIVLM